MANLNLHEVVLPAGEIHASNAWAQKQAPGARASFYPAVVQYYNKPNGTKEPIKFSPEMLRHLEKVQSDRAAYEAILWIAGGAFNQGPNAFYLPAKRQANVRYYIPPDGPWPQPPVGEPITTIGNVVNVLEIKNGWARIETLAMKGPWPPPSTHPWLYNKPVKSIRVLEDGKAGKVELGNAILDRGVIYPMYSRNGQAWIEMKWLRKVAQPQPTNEVRTMAVRNDFAQGIDLSRWQPSYDPMVRPVDFVILKASEGSTWLDPKFDVHLAVCDAAGLLVGAYHYYRSGIPWRAQLENFLRATQGKRLSKLLAIDYEYINNKLDASTDKELKAFYDALVQRGYKPVIYTSHGEYMSMMARGAKWISDPSIGMWIARWFERSYYYNHALGPGAAITQWTKGHCIWQYGGDYKDKSGWVVPGYGEGKAYGVQSHSIDLNVFNGTVEQMRAWLGIDPEPLEGEASTIPVRARRRFLQPMPR